MEQSDVDFSRVKHVVFDLDGTIWNWEGLLPGVKETVQKLRNKGVETFFCTNNTLLSREFFAKKLAEFGLQTQPRKIISAGYASAKKLAENGVRDVYVLGETGLIKELERFNIKTTAETGNVLVSLDRNITYWKLWKALRLIREEGAAFYATAEGALFPVGEKMLPGEKSIVKGLEAITGVTPTIFGKPSDHMVDVVKNEWKLPWQDTLFVGDHPASDVVFAKKLGCIPSLVMGGVTSETEVKQLDEEHAPKIVFRSFRRLLRRL